MTKREISSAEISILIAAYSEAARTHGQATESGDYTMGNKAADLIAAIYAELRRRGRPAQAALLPLLSHNDPGIRLWAASHSLEFSPGDGASVLSELEAVGRFLGLSAKATLTTWKNGELKFPD